MAASPSVVGALATTLASLSADFDADELAYLALTGTAGQPVRDRLAWRLQQELGEAHVVARGWRRADIAVLAGETPVLQVEAKAMYAFDLLGATSRTGHLAELVANGLKMSALAPEGSACLLALVTHVDGTVPEHLREHVVKHAAGIRAALDREGSAEAVAARARKTWEAEIARLGWPSARFTLGGGSMWGLGVEVDAYLVGPLPPGEA